MNISSNKTDILEQESELFFTQLNIRTDVSNLIDSCVEYSVEDSIEVTGIRQETISQYKNLVSSRTKECSTPLISQLKEQNYNVEEGDIEVNVELNPETIIVEVTYPLTIEKKDDRIVFEKFHYVFDRTSHVNIPKGVADKEIILMSSNEKAEIRIPEGVKLSDENGNPIESISIKVEDRHFDGLENRYVLGQIVYENLPEGTQFSKPVQIAIEFNKEDIPEGYTEENIKLGYWDDEIGIWRAVPTEIRNNIATANITHFTNIIHVLTKSHLIENQVFEQRFFPTDTDYWKVINLEGPAVLKDKNALINYNDGVSHFEDFKTTFEQLRGEYIVPPTLEYGYFDNGEKTGEFINCEATANTGHYNFQLDKDNDDFPVYEYRQAVIPKKYSDCRCSSNSDSGCKGRISDGELIDEKYFCLVPEGADKIEVEITDEKTGEITKKCYYNCIKRNSKEIGWHSVKCSGGQLTADGDGLADFIVFEPNGNAVMFGDTEGVSDVYAATYPPKKPFNKVSLFNYIFDNINYAKSEFFRGYNFDCEFINPTIKEFTPEESRKLRNVISSKTRYEIEDDQDFVIYGTDGVVISRLDKENRNEQLHTRCDIYWFFVGNGYLRSNTPGVGKDIVESNNVPLSEHLDGWRQILKIYVPDEVRRGQMTIGEFIIENGKELWESLTKSK